MRNGFSVKHVGNKQTQRMFALLPDKVARKVVRKATNAASRIVTRALKANMPVDTGAAKAAVDQKIVTYKEDRKILGIVGVNKAKSKGDRKPRRYFDKIERGFIARDGRFVPGSFPKLRAWNSTAGERERIFGEKLGKEIDAEAIKLGFRGR